MTIHYKIGGVWTPVVRPYIKLNGVWTPVQQAYVKRSGVWTEAFEWDVTPPNSPEVSLQIIETAAGGQHIKVGVRQPGGTHDASLKRIRVLTNYPPPLGDMPNNHDGGTYTSQADKTYPNEPWSEWRYNSFGNHSDSSAYVYKQWGGKPNPADSFVTPTGTYKFAAWSQDDNGNWSAGTFASIFMPKPSVDASNLIRKEKRVQANNSGSVTVGGFDVDGSGKLIQRDTPNSYGLWFYGTEFTDSIGSQGTPTIKSAQIWIKRTDDTGSPAANLYLFWHEAGNAGALGSAPISLTKHETTYIGTINKGEGKWFDIPSAMWGNFNTDIKGFGLANKDPIKAASFAEDYSVIDTIDSTIKCGEVNIVWEEKP